MDALGSAATWTYDYFGRLTRRTDLGGAVYSYSYDMARQLTSQSNTRGLTITYNYDAAGQLVFQHKVDTSQVLYQDTSYAYDLAGNHIREKVVHNGITYQDNHLAYDALGRLRDVADAQAHLTMAYDLGKRPAIPS